MAYFTYRAKNNAGKVSSGSVEAENVSAATAILRQKRLEVISISESRLAGILKYLPQANPVTLKDVVIFSRQFSTMINAGLPIMQGLSILTEQAPNKSFGKVLGRVRDDLSNGMSLSDAIAKFPRVFNNLYVNMVKAGEQGGILDAVLERLSEYMEKAEAISRKVKSALMYPVVVSSVAVAVIFFLMWKVIPVFENVFTSFGSHLPGITMVVVNISHFVCSYRFIYLIIGAVVVFTGVSAYRKTKRGAYQWDSMMLKIPVFGVLLQKAAVAKFARTFSTLIKSGVPIVDALETVAKTAGNLVVEKAVLGCRDSIREGKTLTEPLKKFPIFPPMVVQMINVGEETGAMDTMLSKVADFYEDEVDTAVEGLTSIIEPIMIVFLGLVVGFIVVAMYMPLFDLPGIIH
jgi:type IV pilus assembly protein PilC